MELTEIKRKKKLGDLVVASQMLGISLKNTQMVLRRPGARRHPALLEAMARIIRAREALLAGAAGNEQPETATGCAHHH